MVTFGYASEYCMQFSTALKPDKGVPGLDTHHSWLERAVEGGAERPATDSVPQGT